MYQSLVVCMQRECECSPQLHFAQYQSRFVVLNPSVALLIRIFCPTDYCADCIVNRTRLISSIPVAFFWSCLYFSRNSNYTGFFLLMKSIKMRFGDIFGRIWQFWNSNVVCIVWAQMRLHQAIHHRVIWLITPRAYMINL